MLAKWRASGGERNKLYSRRLAPRGHDKKHPNSGTVESLFVLVGSVFWFALPLFAFLCKRRGRNNCDFSGVWCQLIVNFIWQFLWSLLIKWIHYICIAIIVLITAINCIENIPKRKCSSPFCKLSQKESRKNTQFPFFSNTDRYTGVFFIVIYILYCVPITCICALFKSASILIHAILQENVLLVWQFLLEKKKKLHS